MKIKVEKSLTKGDIIAPPSKSYAHRLLIASYLSNSENVVSNISFSNDINATLGCLKSLGASFIIRGNEVFFDGKNKQNTDDVIILNALESGSTLRFLIPISLVLYPNRTIVIKGTKKLLSRGLNVYEKIFNQDGIEYKIEEESITYKGELKGSNYEILGNLSSQYVSGLLFSLPLLKVDSKITIIKPIESVPYINMTLDSLNRFNVRAMMYDNIITIKGNQKYIGVKQIVEGDYSNSAFLEALNYINTKNKVKVLGLNKNSIQGDKEYINIFKNLATYEATIDISNTVDLGPITFALAYINGARITGVSRLRMKESNRVDELVMELKKFGAKIDVFDDYVVVHKVALIPPKETLDAHNDHRIAMSLCVLASNFGGIIDGVESINKSYPSFLDDLERIGLNYEVID